MRHSQRKRRANSLGRTYGASAPVLDPTGEGDELIRQDLSLIFEVMKGKLSAFFIREKASARLSQEAKEHELADFCIAAVQGAMLIGKIHRSSQVAQVAIREAIAHLRRYAITPK